MHSRLHFLKIKFLWLFAFYAQNREMLTYILEVVFTFSLVFAKAAYRYASTHKIYTHTVAIVMRASS